MFAEQETQTLNLQDKLSVATAESTDNTPSLESFQSEEHVKEQAETK